MLRRVFKALEDFFEVLPAYGVYLVLRDVNATACDHGYHTD